MSRYKGFSNHDLAGLTLYERMLLHCRHENGHLVWEGAQDEQGYPVFNAIENGKHRRYLVRRYLFLREYPDIKDPWVSNNCGHELCVLPAHQEDRKRWPKSAVGVRRTRAMRSMRVSLIQRLGRDGFTAVEIAHGLNLHLGTVQRILNRL